MERFPACLLLALSVDFEQSLPLLQLGVKQTCRGHRQSVEIDPKAAIDGTQQSACPQPGQALPCYGVLRCSKHFPSWSDAVKWRAFLK